MANSSTIVARLLFPIQADFHHPDRGISDQNPQEPGVLGGAVTKVTANRASRLSRWLRADLWRVGERLGLFGGTFDPPHVGHLVTAVNVRHEMRLDRILLVVANDPWQKHGTREVSPAADRLAMVEA